MAANIVHPDIRNFVDVSASASSQVFFKRLNAFHVYSEMQDVKEEVSRLYGDSQVSIEEATDVILKTASSNPSSDSQQDLLVYTLIPKLAEIYQRDLTGTPGVGDILDAILELCETAIMEQMKALYGKRETTGSSPMLPSPVSVKIRNQLNAYTESWEKSIPYALTSDNEKRGGGDPEYAGVFPNQVRNLKDHFQMAYVTMARVNVPPERLSYFPYVMRDLVYYFMQPWLAFKYLASFVPGDWNRNAGKDGRNVSVSFNDQRYAEFAIYRSVIDLASEYKKLISVLNLEQLSRYEGMGETMMSLVQTMVDTMNDEHIKKVADQIPNWFDVVSAKSAETKEDSKVLEKNNESVELRKKKLKVMMENEQAVANIVRNARIKFWVIVAVYIAMTGLLGALLFRQAFFAVYVMSVIFMLASLVLYLVSVMSTRRKKIFS